MWLVGLVPQQKKDSSSITINKGTLLYPKGTCLDIKHSTPGHTERTEITQTLSPNYIHFMPLLIQNIVILIKSHTHQSIIFIIHKTYHKTGDIKPSNHVHHTDNIPQNFITIWKHHHPIIIININIITSLSNINIHTTNHNIIIQTTTPLANNRSQLLASTLWLHS